MLCREWCYSVRRNLLLHTIRGRGIATNAGSLGLDAPTMGLAHHYAVFSFARRLLRGSKGNWAHGDMLCGSRPAASGKAKSKRNENMSAFDTSVYEHCVIRDGFRIKRARPMGLAGACGFTRLQQFSLEGLPRPGDEAPSLKVRLMQRGVRFDAGIADE